MLSFYRNDFFPSRAAEKQVLAIINLPIINPLRNNASRVKTTDWWYWNRR